MDMGRPILSTTCIVESSRLLRSLCFLYSLLIIAGLCHSVKNRGDAISNDGMVAHFGCKQRLLKLNHIESLECVSNGSFIQKSGKTNHTEAWLTVMWLYLMNYSSSRITLFCRLIDFSWRHVRLGQNESWFFINKLLKDNSRKFVCKWETG